MSKYEQLKATDDIAAEDAPQDAPHKVNWWGKKDDALALK